MDADSIKYFIMNLSEIKNQNDRGYLWIVLFDSLKLQKMTPKQYVQLVIDNIKDETDQQTIMYIIGKLKYVMTNFIKTEDKAILS